MSHSLHPDRALLLSGLIADIIQKSALAGKELYDELLVVYSLPTSVI